MTRHKLIHNCYNKYKVRWNTSLVFFYNSFSIILDKWEVMKWISISTIVQISIPRFLIKKVNKSTIILPLFSKNYIHFKKRHKNLLTSYFIKSINFNAEFQVSIFFECNNIRMLEPHNLAAFVSWRCNRSKCRSQSLKFFNIMFVADF